MDRGNKLKLDGIRVNICSKFERLQLCCRAFRRSVAILEFSHLSVREALTSGRLPFG